MPVKGLIPGAVPGAGCLGGSSGLPELPGIPPAKGLAPTGGCMGVGACGCFMSWLLNLTWGWDSLSLRNLWRGG
eukprot:6296813-Amphidinium_carterae.1